VQAVRSVTAIKEMHMRRHITLQGRFMP
jgi:hypothetical protein